MQTGFYFDQTRCTGCFTCAVACKDWHDIPAGPAKWMRVIYREEGNFPDVFVSHVASPCYHCVDPVCFFVCPNEAITKRDNDGIVVVDREKCRQEHACGIISETAMGPDFRYGEAVAPCQAACPAHLYVPGYIALIAKGKYKESLNLIRQRMPLPSVCGRACLHPCEMACRRKDVEDPVAIMALKRFVTDNVSQELPDRLSQTRPEKVAIIGSGPAGLAAAYDLVRMGYGVTVFEGLPVAGGMLSVGIPRDRLPADALKNDIAYLEALGIEIKTGSPVNLDKDIESLANQGYGAILLVIGAHKGKKPNIPGVNLNGTTVGTTFMRSVNTDAATKVGRKVVVVGGGNVALDCARTALRLKATDVYVVCLESKEQMPGEKSLLEQAEQEGIHVYTSCTVSQVLGRDNKVTGIECSGITALHFDTDGKPDFNVKKGTEQVIPADTVIFAIGQTPDLASSGESITTERSGTLVADSETMMTKQNGVFVAGDCFNGATSIVDAIASGQKAASYINRFLQGDVLRVQPEKTIEEASIKVEIPANTEKRPRQSMRLLPVADRVTNFNEVALGFSEEAARDEASRCLNCAGHLCKDVCPYSAPQFADEAKARMQKCDLCLERWTDNKKPICVEACPARALDAGSLEELKSKYGDKTDASGFAYSTLVKPAIINKPKHPPR